jgi:hypothetical protein
VAAAVEVAVVGLLMMKLDTNLFGGHLLCVHSGCACWDSYNEMSLSELHVCLNNRGRWLRR